MYMDSSEAGFLVGRNRSKFLKWEHKRMKLPKRQRRVQGFTYSMPWHAIFAFLNPLLIGVLQVKGQGSGVSPFDTHPADMWTFLLATLVYCFACAANIKCHHQRTGGYSQISGHVALISGSLSSISLLSVFLPSLLGRLIFFSWLILPIIVARQLNIHHFCHWLYQCTRKALLFLFLNTIGNRLRDSNANLANEQPQPPV